MTYTVVVLNKTDLVSPEHVEVIRDWIGLHMQPVRIVEATHGDAPLEILLSVGRFDAAGLIEKGNGDEAGHLERAGNVFETWSFETDRPLSVDALRVMVRRSLPASVHRCKGIVYSADQPDTRLALQVVGRRTEIIELDAWGERTPRSDIVAIGSKDMDGTVLTTLFEGCLAMPAPEDT